MSRIASSARLEGERRRLGEVVDQADAADGRGRQDRAAIGLVVERDVAGHDREVERPAGLGDAADAADQLAHDLRPLGIAEIEIVGDRERPRADRGEVAPGFRHRLLAAFERIGLAIARRHVAGERERLRALVDAHHRGVAAGPLHRVAQNDVIVLLPHPALGAEVGRADQPQQRVGGRQRAASRRPALSTAGLRRLRHAAGHRPAPRRRAP